MNFSRNTSLIKQESKRLGFDFCGISKAEFLDEEALRLEKWLKEEKHGKMGYMENHFDMRLDPRVLVPNAKSVISLLLNYFPESSRHAELVSASGETLKQVQGDSHSQPKISKYAYGKDYHFVIKEKLFQLIEFIKKNIGDVNARAFVDSAPVMDKVWAKKSGLGWIGKNSNLITKNNGSFFFIAELIVDLDLEYDGEIPDYCGTCTKCVDACPTDAISEPYVVDGSKCISYFTIELKENIPNDMKGKFNDWMFGCDICQDVCPWNSFSSPHHEPHFQPKPEILNFTKKDWEEISEETFNKTFSDSPLQRTKHKGIKRNLEFLNLGNRLPENFSDNILVHSKVGEAPDVE
ncbi:MAG: tRNA epoxyqueuosine(34) reductase QueG [Bacteroidetes bacterium]|nr:tRNA epoxyqueuosine(34) reductase QueG [Bacteroidota bacterium]